MSTATANPNIVLGKWRKAVSVTKNDITGEIKLYRYDKNENRWKQIMYFSTQNDYDEFVDFLDETIPEDDNA